MARKKKPEPYIPPDDDEWEAFFNSLSDEEQLARVRQCRDGLAQLIAEGNDYDPQLVVGLDEAIVKFEKAIEAEKIATERSRVAHEKLNRTADALLALLPENVPISFYVPPKSASRKKGN